MLQRCIVACYRKYIAMLYHSNIVWSASFVESRKDTEEMNSYGLKLQSVRCTHCQCLLMCLLMCEWVGEIHVRICVHMCVHEPFDSPYFPGCKVLHAHTYTHAHTPHTGSAPGPAVLMKQPVSSYLHYIQSSGHCQQLHCSFPLSHTYTGCLHVSAS